MQIVDWSDQSARREKPPSLTTRAFLLVSVLGTDEIGWVSLHGASVDAGIHCTRHIGAPGPNKLKEAEFT